VYTLVWTSLTLGTRGKKREEEGRRGTRGKKRKIGHSHTAALVQQDVCCSRKTVLVPILQMGACVYVSKRRGERGGRLVQRMACQVISLKLICLWNESREVYHLFVE